MPINCGTCAEIKKKRYANCDTHSLSPLTELINVTREKKAKRKKPYCYKKATERIVTIQALNTSFMHIEQSPVIETKSRRKQESSPYRKSARFQYFPSLFIRSPLVYFKMFAFFSACYACTSGSSSRKKAGLFSIAATFMEISTFIGTLCVCGETSSEKSRQ